MEVVVEEVDLGEVMMEGKFFCSYDRSVMIFTDAE